METLGTIIVSLATFVGALVPQANFSEVLGEKIAQDTTVTDTVMDLDDTTDVGTPSGARQEALDAARARRQEALEEARARREEARQEWQAKRDEFKQKLAEIRDEQKQAILEHIADRLDYINDRWTTHWDNVLSRLSEILAKIGTRADKLEETGNDMDAVRDAIVDAEVAIDTAQDAVNAQAENSYIIEITDEEGLGDDVQAVRNQLHDDLRSSREVVRAARQAVHDAFQALKDARTGVDTEGGTDSE